MTKIKLIEEFKKLGFTMSEKMGGNFYYVFNEKNNKVKSFSTIRKGIIELEDIKKNLEYFLKR